MYTKEFILEKLSSFGAPQNEAESAMNDVLQIILARIFKAYLETIPVEQQELLKKANDAELIAYFENHQVVLPGITPAKFEEIYNTTWDEYFEAMK